MTSQSEQGTTVKNVWCGNELSESNESVYERCNIGSCVNRVKCCVVEWVEINTLKWFDYFERKNSEQFAKKVYASEIKGPRRRGRPVVKWKDLVKEYMHERVVGRRRGIE